MTPPDQSEKIVNAPSRPPVAVDLHIHTSHSHGAAGTADMFEAACAAGLEVVGFSEHSPRPAGFVYPNDYQEKLRADFAGYIREVREAATLGKERGVMVLLGLEADYIAGREEYVQALCRDYPYDYVIGGLHFQGTWGFDADAADWDRLSEDERFAAYERYYEDLGRMCRTGLFNIAAHPDLIKIFSRESFERWLAGPRGEECVRAALTAAGDSGTAMEVSSAGLRKPCKEIYPGPAIMRIAADLGLSISFGSDAHCTATPAYAFAELARYAASFGFSDSVWFEQRRARRKPFTVPAPLS